MDDTEAENKRLINAINIYDKLLTANSKPLLTKYVLKVCLSDHAKIRLKTNYSDKAKLIKEIRANFTSTTPPAVLLKRINTRKQNGRSVLEFGKKLKFLMTNLKIS